METSIKTVTCPICGSVNRYTVTDLQMIDSDLNATYICDECRSRFTNTYALVYAGGYTETFAYDRDNLKTTR